MELNIKAANAEIDRLRVELSEITETVKSHAESVADLTVERNTLLSATLALNETHATQSEEIVEKLAAAEARVVELMATAQEAQDRAVEIVSKAGFPAAVAANSEPATAGDLWAQYHALGSSAEKNKFYAANRAAFVSSK